MTHTFSFSKVLDWLIGEASVPRWIIMLFVVMFVLPNTSLRTHYVTIPLLVVLVVVGSYDAFRKWFQ